MRQGGQDTTVENTTNSETLRGPQQKLDNLLVLENEGNVREVSWGLTAKHYVAFSECLLSEQVLFIQVSVVCV